MRMTYTADPGYCFEVTSATSLREIAGCADFQAYTVTELELSEMFLTLKFSTDLLMCDYVK